jgi:hypothetical protein
MNIESFPFRSTAQEVLPVSIQKAIELYKDRLARSGEMIDPHIFTHYGDGVARDEKTVAELEALFQAENSPIQKINKQFATAFEAVIYEHVEISDWMGGNTRTIKTVPFDDYVNGIDLILEINPDLPDQDPSHVALGIDVTFGGGSSLDRKFEKLREKIRTGQFPRIKYFQSGDFLGMKMNLPEVILGVSRELVGDLAALYTRTDKEGKLQLGKHPVQNLLAQQVLAQLHAFARFADKNNQPAFAAKLRSMNTLLFPALSEKAKKGSREFGTDPVHMAIMRQAESI